jgi:hypothetical protein
MYSCHDYDFVIRRRLAFRVSYSIIYHSIESDVVFGVVYGDIIHGYVMLLNNSLVLT